MPWTIVSGDVGVITTLSVGVGTPDGLQLVGVSPGRRHQGQPK